MPRRNQPLMKLSKNDNSITLKPAVFWRNIVKLCMLKEYDDQERIKEIVMQLKYLFNVDMKNARLYDYLHNVLDNALSTLLTKGKDGSKIKVLPMLWEHIRLIASQPGNPIPQIKEISFWGVEGEIKQTLSSLPYYMCVNGRVYIQPEVGTHHLNFDGTPSYTERFTSVSMFIDDLAKVQKGKKFYHILRDGTPAYEGRFDQLGKFVEGKAKVRNNGVEYHILRDGSPAYSETFDKAYDFRDSLARVKKGKDWYHILPDGSPAYTERFDELEVFYNGRAVTKKGEEWYHILPDGSPAYKQRFDRVEIFYEDRAVVRKGEDWYHILPDGTPAYPLRFEIVAHYYNGKAEARKGLYKFFIKKNGDFVDGAFVYSECHDLVNSFNENRAGVRDRGMWYHILPDNTPAYVERYDEVRDFRNGRAMVRIGNQWQEILPDGSPAYQDWRQVLKNLKIFFLRLKRKLKNYKIGNIL